MWTFQLSTLRCPYMGIVRVMEILPRDVLSLIFSFLPENYHAILRFVCVYWAKVLPPIKNSCKDYFEYIDKKKTSSLMHYIRGYLDCGDFIEYVYKKGCPLTRNDMVYAVMNNNLIALRWVKGKGIKLNANLYSIAKTKKYTDIMVYLSNKGYGPSKVPATGPRFVLF